MISFYRTLLGHELKDIFRVYNHVRYCLYELPVPVVDETWLLSEVLGGRELVLELGKGELVTSLAADIRRIGWEQLLPSAQVESGQPHSNCFTRAACLATLCFSISCVTMASTVSAVCNLKFWEKINLNSNTKRKVLLSNI